MWRTCASVSCARPRGVSPSPARAGGRRLRRPRCSASMLCLANRRLGRAKASPGEKLNQRRRPAAGPGSLSTSPLSPLSSRRSSPMPGVRVSVLVQHQGVAKIGGSPSDCGRTNARRQCRWRARTSESSGLLALESVTVFSPRCRVVCMERTHSPPDQCASCR